MSGIIANGLYKIFGKDPARGVQALRTGTTRTELRDQGLTAAVIDASFEVVPGEVFVVMGLSGSGKSTLLRMVNGLHPATAGELRLGGRLITEMSEAELRSVRRDNISMVFQNFALLPHRTVGENAAYGLEIKGVGKTEREEKATKALELVGLDGWSHYRPDELSGGMKQRVGLARALANDAEILLMDEAFSALDPLIRKEMQDYLLNLQAELGKTVVFITHDLDEAMRVGDRIAVMRDGRIEQIGTGGEILRKPANSYVAQFIQDIDRARVLVAGDICTQSESKQFVSAALSSELIVNSRTPIAHLFTLSARNDAPLVVKNDIGEIEGIITRERLLAAAANDTNLFEESGR
ncbi:quaternary amine ABC transporter ATP-binding protein [Corynebacterium pseudodiphtheriticum]|uniref:quaternary amine ABC transporter ATP-binding protein n=1 Tax=Corynebacterium pseudodiphtheriticum TaxID=37637 RepID=UPI00254CE316|nr:glycine betaine/L-proline ABC transporter ATP-binding protein [Corynebacterium pseudodiphtheriticum]MDK8562463.1 glycine betaine/L-proline ABC transporter ATP-binding protein [Corynebacterium pseudodiphtheriticum]